MAYTSSFPGTPLVEASNGDVPADVVLGIDAAPRSKANRVVSAGHTGDVTSWSFTIDGALGDDRLQEVFDSLPSSLLRAKGILHLASQPDRSTLVLIDRAGSIDPSALEADLVACRDSATAATEAGGHYDAAVGDE